VEMEDGGDTKVRMTAGRMKERMNEERENDTLAWYDHPCEGEKAALGDEKRLKGRERTQLALVTHKTIKNSLQLVTDTCYRGLSCAERAVTGFEEGSEITRSRPSGLEGGPQMHACV